LISLPVLRKQFKYSEMGSKVNLTDEVGRARKILARNTPNKVSGLSKRATTLTDSSAQIGQNCVVQIVHPEGVEQFTICRPIGITKLDADRDWVILNTDHVAATLARREDPGEQAYNQACAKVRTDMAVAKGLLEIRGAPGNPEIFLPKEKNPRNVVLASASQMLKATKAGIRAQLESAKDKDHIGKLNRDLGAITDNLGFIEPEATRHAEAELRKFWASSDVKAAVNKVPRGFETKTGPYGDKSQLPLEGARDKTLRQVVDMLAGAIASQAVVRRTSQGILGSGGGPPTPGESPGRGSSATGGGKPTTPPAAAATSGNSGKSSSGGKS
jgi:hypothetical protein